MPDGSAPHLVPLTRTVSLIVADVPAKSYRAGAIESRLRDLDWVSRCGSAHHAVADALALAHTVVPLRLFTLFSSEESARATLGAASARIAAAIERVRGKAEWVLHIGPPDPAGTARSSAGHAPPTTGTSFLAQKAAVKRAASDLAAIVRDDAQRTVERLAAAASEVSRRKDAAAGLLVDAAFLVPARGAAAFKRELSHAAERLLAAGCRVSLTGPWPPYSFVDIADGDGGA